MYAKINFIFIFILFLSGTYIYAQTSLTGKFLSSEAKIGEPIEYRLTFKHHKNMEIFFPDSSYQYAPFELVSKKYFPTYTIDSISTDSVIYLLRTFELKDKIIYALPVFTISGNDTLVLYPEKDLLNIRKINFDEHSQASLLADTSLMLISKRINYPYWIAAILMMVALLFLLYKLFGKTILRRYKLYVIYREHIHFLQAFDTLLKKFTDTQDIRIVEKALIEWRSYLTKLIHKPVHTYTSTEIMTLFQDEALKTNLQVLDRSVYGGILSTDVLHALDFIRKFSTAQYRIIRNTIHST
ncbi:MAG: hypothetical protein NZ529_01850 [Cytophagaceae bacterium]|nr:hypothetical protein [Cytophagaceae bacterium]MDW8455511.1 hypothetical protein [Cytophagaceae bacterium]